MTEIEINPENIAKSRERKLTEDPAKGAAQSVRKDVKDTRVHPRLNHREAVAEVPEARLHQVVQSPHPGLSQRRHQAKQQTRKISITSQNSR